VPDLVTSAANRLVGPMAGYRLVLLLLVAVFVLFALWLRQTSRLNRQERKLVGLMDALTARHFVEHNPRLDVEGQVLAVIPAYNEEDAIEHVLKDMPAEAAGLRVQPLVVDDASRDRTAEVVRKLGVPVVSNPMNRGGGGALRVGYALGDALGAKVVVTLDADGQHLPEQMERLVKPIVDDEADLVVGSRIVGDTEGGPLIRRAGIFFFNRLVSVLLLTKVTDCSSGYKAIRTEWLDRVQLTQEQFHTTDFLISMVRAGVRFREAPITIKLRVAGESKKGSSLSYGLGFSRAIFSAWWRN
jgi:glycosyltransferase involved in cell wall biosynthesis